MSEEGAKEFIKDNKWAMAKCSARIAKRLCRPCFKKVLVIVKEKGIATWDVNVLCEKCKFMAEKELQNAIR